MLCAFLPTLGGDYIAIHRTRSGLQVGTKLGTGKLLKTRAEDNYANDGMGRLPAKFRPKIQRDRGSNAVALSFHVPGFLFASSK